MSVREIKEYWIQVKIPETYETFDAIIRNGELERLNGNIEKCTRSRIESYIEFLKEVLQYLKK